VRIIHLSALALVPLTLLAGCAPAEPAPAASEPTSVTVTNCGFELTVDSPPQRIVTIKSTSTELVLALGLGDRIVGQAFPDGPVPDELATVDVPVISDFAPSEEAVLELEPDFVFGGWESNFTAENAGDRAELKDLGIASYVSPAACKGDYQPAHLSFDDIFGYITEAGDLLGAPDAAADLVAAQSAELADISADDSGMTALWWSSGTDTPYVGAGIGAPQLIMDTVGLTNIAGDIADTWSPFSVEAIIAANPDFIVLVDASWNTAESKKAYLASNPATAAMPAVANQRYLVVPFAAGEAGVRSVSAATSLAEQLAALQ
jgi:iron complex transport system substrate-binding protein